jgi:hypothetical protein
MRVQALGQLVRHAAFGDFIRFHPMEGDTVLGAAGTTRQAGMGHGKPAFGRQRGDGEGTEFSTLPGRAQEFSSAATIGR